MAISKRNYFYPFFSLIFFLIFGGLNSNLAIKAIAKEVSGTFPTDVLLDGKKISLNYVGNLYRGGTPQAILFHFHGDGGRKGYKGALDPLKKLSSKYKTHVFAVQAPSFSWQKGFDGMGGKHVYPKAQAFNFFKDYVVEKHHAKNAKLIFSGISGGANYVGGHFIPIYGKGFQGGMILLCGGATTAMFGANGQAIFHTTPAFAKGFRVYQYIVTGDHLFQYANAMKRDYSALGAKVNAIWPKGNGHCAFPIYKKLEEGLDWILSSF